MSVSTRTDHRKLTVVIVDDEPLAREGIRMLLADDPEISIAAECGDSDSAVREILAVRPDLVFLDIQMPGASGFDVIRTIGIKRMPATIFVTAYDKYAVRAFEMQALDYLLKPYTKRRFAAVLERAKEKMLRDPVEVTTNRLLTLMDEMGEHRYCRRIVVKARGRILFVPVNDVVFFEAQGNYIRLHSKNSAHLIHATMQDLGASLDPRSFVRIHRSYIVNVDHIKEIQSMFHRGYAVVMNTGDRLISGHAYRSSLEELVHNRF